MAALLLDENLPRSAGDVVERAGHDVQHMADVDPAADDRRVLALARASGRMRVTFDADFGDLVYRHGEPAPPAILYLRLHPIDADLAAALVLQALEESVQGQFVVCTREGRRSRPLSLRP